MTNAYRQRWLILLGLLILTTAVYSSVLRNGFVWDDFLLFIDNTSLRSGSFDWSTLSRPVLDGTTYLRPVVLLSFAFEFSIWGVNAVAAHATNLALHLLNVALVYGLAHSLLNKMGRTHVEWRAGVGALFYALHPSLIEATAWISGRFDLMVTTFILLALLVDAWILDRWKRAVVLGVCFALALGAKELAVVLPALLLCLRLARSETRVRPLAGVRLLLANDWPSIASLGLVFIGYVLLRIHTFDALIHSEPLFTKSENGTQLHLLLIANTLTFYAGEIVAPFASFAPFHPLNLKELSGWIGGTRSLAAALLLTAVGYALFRAFRTAFIIACTFIALIPVLQIVPLTIGGNIGHDRFLTLPLVFVALTLSALSIDIPGWRQPARRASIGFAAVVWFGLCVASITVTIPLWRDPLSLWAWTYQKYPDFEPAQSSYLAASMRAERLDLAAPVFERLVATRTMVARQNFLYGTYLIEKGEIDEAELYIRGGLRAYERMSDGSLRDAAKTGSWDSERRALAHPHSNLAKIEILRGRYEQALGYSDIAVMYGPDAPYYWVQRGLILLALDRNEEGEKLYAEGLRMTLPANRPVVEAERQRFIERLCSGRDSTLLVVCENGLNKVDHRS